VHSAKAASSIAKQHGYADLFGVGNRTVVRNDDDVRISVAVDVVDRESPWRRARRKRRAGSFSESTFAIAEQEADGVDILARRHDVEPATFGEGGGAHALI